jgi:hypothetical protein
MWLNLLIRLLPVIIELIGGLESHDECPDGTCPPIKEDLAKLQVELEQPRTADAGEVLKCIDFKRLFAAVSEMIAVVRDALNGVCPGE